MKKIELVKAAFDLDNPDQYSYYSDDFQFTDAQGSPPQDKSTWIAMGGLMRSAVPDISLVIDDIREEGDDVVVTVTFLARSPTTLTYRPWAWASSRLQEKPSTLRPALTG